MRFHAAVLSLAAVAPALAQTYVQQYKWQGADFFNNWNFFTDPDPTHGFVKYVDAATAKRNGLTSTTGNTAYMGVDYTSNLAADGSGGGRQSVRLASKASFTQGLFIGDFAHMPGGTCGVWPAWWTVGPAWPHNGEIDIVEGVSRQTHNLASLHTGPNCTVAGAQQSGALAAANCDQYAPGQSGSGCGVSDARAWSFGAGFNALGGGVFAMEWTSSYIRTWYWTRARVPLDVTLGRPNPATWGTPASNFQAACDIPAHFANHNMDLDTTFCGDWAGNVWGADATCAALAPSCNAYVARNPAAFKNAYWLINYIAVYQPTAPVKAANNAALPSVAPNKAAAPAAAVAAGATGPASPGVTPAASTAAPSVLAQLPATANATSGTDLHQRGVEAPAADDVLVA